MAMGVSHFGVKLDKAAALKVEGNVFFKEHQYD